MLIPAELLVTGSRTSGANPATTAVPGDRLRYRLRVENLSDIPLDDLGIFDELDRLNGPPAFEPGTLVVISVPAGADASNTDSICPYSSRLWIRRQTQLARPKSG